MTPIGANTALGQADEEQELEEVMLVQTTGVEDILPGGDAVLREMIIGGQGVGKTRRASYWPSPIYATCDRSIGSVADRKMPYVAIAGARKKPSDQMLEFLNLVKLECSKPPVARRWKTVVIDTLDAYQRLLKQEWIDANNAAGFGGWEAWDFLEQKMQQLLTRLLNLPMNVIINVHYKDVKITEGEGEQASQRIEHQLRLNGQSSDWAPDDFDLIGRMDSFWAMGEDGQRVEQRGITYRRTPDWPLLKDRLHLTGGVWMPVTFSDEDYLGLFRPLIERVGSLEAEGLQASSEEVEVPEEGPPPGVVTEARGGPLPPTVPKGVPMDQVQRTPLMVLARSVPDLQSQVKGNTTKAELVAMLEQHRKDHPADWTDDGRYMPTEGTLQPEAGSEAPAEAPAPEPTPPETAQPEPAQTEAPAPAPSTDVKEPAPAAPPPEAPPPAEEQSAPQPQAAAPPPVPSPPAPADTTATEQGQSQDEELCNKPDCTPALPGTDTNVIRLGAIKYRRVMCGECYQQCKNNNGEVPEGRGYEPKRFNQLRATS